MYGVGRSGTYHIPTGSLPSQTSTGAPPLFDLGGLHQPTRHPSPPVLSAVYIVVVSRYLAEQRYGVVIRTLGQGTFTYWPIPYQ